MNVDELRRERWHAQKKRHRGIFDKNLEAIAENTKLFSAQEYTAFDTEKAANDALPRVRLYLRLSDFQKRLTELNSLAQNDSAIDFSKKTEKILSYFLTTQTTQRMPTNAGSLCVIVLSAYDGDDLKAAQLFHFLQHGLRRHFETPINAEGDRQLNLETLFLSEVVCINLPKLREALNRLRFDSQSLLALTRRWCGGLLCGAVFPAEFGLAAIGLFLHMGPSALIAASYEILGVLAERISAAESLPNLFAELRNSVFEELLPAPGQKRDPLKRMCSQSAKILGYRANEAAPARNMLDKYTKAMSWEAFVASALPLELARNNGRKEGAKANAKAASKKNEAAVALGEEELSALLRPPELLRAGAFGGRHFYVANDSFLSQDALFVRRKKTQKLPAPPGKPASTSSRKYMTKNLGRPDKSAAITPQDLPLDYEKVCRAVAFPCLLMQGWLRRRTGADAYSPAWFWLEDRFFGFSREAHARPRRVVDVSDAEVSRAQWGEGGRFGVEVVVFLEEPEEQKKKTLKDFINKFKTVRLKERKGSFAPNKFELYGEDEEEMVNWLKAFEYATGKR